MLDKVKNIIKTNKENKEIYNYYVKIFSNIKKSKELFGENDEFKKISEIKKDIKDSD